MNLENFTHGAIALFLSLLLTSQELCAQSFATVGTGTTSNNNVSFPAPYGSANWGNRNQFLVKASELTAAGLSAGYIINAVGFNVTALNTASSFQDWTMKVYATATANPLSGVWQSSGLVASSTPTNQTITTGWMMTPMATSFTWNGTDNLVIETCFNNTSAASNAATQWTTNLSGATHSRWYRTNAGGVCASTLVTSSTTTSRPNIRFQYFGTPCSGSPIAGATTVSNSNTCPGSLVSLGLSGNTLVTGLTYQWEEAASSGGPWTTIAGATGLSQNVTVSSTSYYRAAVTCSGNTSYSTPALVSVIPVIAGGTYTVDNTQPTAGNNFHSFAEFTAAATGISGPIVVNVTPGTYNEPLILTHLCGTSATNTVTINGNGATLSYVSSNPGQKGVVRIDNTDYVTINNLNVDGYSTSVSDYAWGFFLTNDADNITINGCTVTLDSNTTLANYAGIVASGSDASAITQGSGCDNITLTNNTVNGGFYGIAVMGSSVSVIQNWNISNNTVKNFHNYGIYGGGTNNTLIDNNDIHRTGRSVISTFGGIYLVIFNSSLKVSRNRIHDPATASPASNFTLNGIFLQDSQAPSGSTNEITNNIIYSMNGTGSHFYINNDHSGNTEYYYNTVYSEASANIATGITYGFKSALTNGTSSVTFRNNNIVIKRNANNTKRCIYVASGATTVESDYNNFFINGLGYNFTGFIGVDDKTLADWQWDSGLDDHSTDFDPLFTNAATGDLTPMNPSLDNEGHAVSGTTTDILGNVRSAATPDMGAFEFAVPACSGMPLGGTAATNTNLGCPGGPVNLSVSGNTVATGITIQWQSSPAGAGTWSNIAGGISQDFEDVVATMPSAPTDFRAAISCGGNTSYSTTVSVGLQPWYMCYCSPLTGNTLENSDGSYNSVTGVSITGTTLNNPSTLFGDGGYTRHDPAVTSQTATLLQNASYTFAVNVDNSGQKVAGWIDYDQSGTFDASEFITFSGSGTVRTAAVLIPASSITGLTGFRVRQYQGSVPGIASGACTIYSSSYETEDYVITLSVNNQCAGTPAAGTATASADTVCHGGNIGLNATGFTALQNISLQWQVSPSGQNSWSNIAGATNAGYTYANAAADLDFRLAVSCDNPGGGLATSNVVTVVVVTPETPTITPSGPTTICTAGGMVTLTASSGASYTWSNTSHNQSLNVFQAGTYSVTVYSALGCAATSAPITITTKAMPNVIKINNTGSTAVCDPETIPLYLDLAAGTTTGFAYQWKLNGSTIPGATDSIYSADASGSYTLVVSGGGSCSRESSPKTLNVKPLPTASFTAAGPITFCAGSSVVLNADVQPGYVYKWLRDGLNAGAKTSLTAKVTGNYLLIAKLNGCSDTSSSVSITANPAPVASISSSDPTTFCAGDQAVLQASPSGAGFGFQWQNGTMVLSGETDDNYSATASGTYKVMVTDDNGCVSKPSAGVKVKVNAIPTASITALGPTDLPVGGSVKLRANNGTGLSWQWNRNGSPISGATMRDYIATAEGDYNVTVTRSGCEANSGTITVTETMIKPTPGVSSVSEEEFSLLAYPNPANDEVTVAIKGLETVRATVQIMDITGKLIAAKEMNGTTLSFDLRGQAPGAYLIRYKDDQRSGSIRIVKQ